MNDTLGSRVKFARSQARLKRGDVAKKSGMAYSTLADIENDATSTCTRIARLSDVLGVSPVWLETGRGPMRSAMNEWLDQQMPTVLALAAGTPPPAPTEYQRALADALMVREPDTQYRLTESLRAEQEIDPYQLIETAFRRLLIVGRSKDDLLARIQAEAEHARQVTAEALRGMNSPSKENKS